MSVVSAVNYMNQSTFHIASEKEGYDSLCGYGHVDPVIPHLPTRYWIDEDNVRVCRDCKRKKDLNREDG